MTTGQPEGADADLNVGKPAARPKSDERLSPRATVGPETGETSLVAGAGAGPGGAAPSSGPPFGTLPVEFGRYRVEKLLGSGAMGAVYLARDSLLDRAVALKVPKLSRSGSAGLLIRMEREAKALAQLDHPNICRVYDFDELQGVHYIALEFVEGETLKSLMQRLGRKRKPAEAVGTIVRLAQALAAAHEKGVVHRDLKPENIMRRPDGRLVIMDFGLNRQSRLGSDAALKTQAGTILGTPTYMSPEQAAGHLEEVDQRSDIYALGVMLYEMLTGELPFSGTAMEVMGRKTVQIAPSPLTVNPKLPEALAAICDRLLAQKREDRPATCAEVAAALKGCDLTPRRTAAEPSADSPQETVYGGQFDFVQEPAGPPHDKSPDSSGLIRSGLEWWTSQPLSLRLSLCAAVAVVGIVMGMILLRSETGTLQVVIEDPSLSVEVAGQTITAQDNSPSIPLPAGSPNSLVVLQHGVEIENGTQQITVGRNETRRVRLGLFNGSIEFNGEPIAQAVSPQHLPPAEGSPESTVTPPPSDPLAQATTPSSSSDASQMGRPAESAQGSWVLTEEIGRRIMDQRGDLLAMITQRFLANSGDAGKNDRIPMPRSPGSLITCYLYDTGAFLEFDGPAPRRWIEVGETCQVNYLFEDLHRDQNDLVLIDRSREGWLIRLTPSQARCDISYDSGATWGPIYSVATLKPKGKANPTDATPASGSTGEVRAEGGQASPKPSEKDVAPGVASAGSIYRGSWTNFLPNGKTSDEEKSECLIRILRRDGAEVEGEWQLARWTSRSTFRGTIAIAPSGEVSLSCKEIRSIPPHPNNSQTTFTATISRDGRQLTGVALDRPVLRSDRSELEAKLVFTPPVAPSVKELALIGTAPRERRLLSPLKITACWIPAGQFTMGTPGDSGAESPVGVIISQGFWLGDTEVHQSQWTQLMGSEPWKGQPFVTEGGNFPASYICQGDDGTHIERDSAVDFCRRLTDMERAAGRLPAGWHYALPTEAEWEYACRAGTTTSYSFGDDAGKLENYGTWSGRYSSIGNRRPPAPSATALKRPNPWWLFDMHGNLWEACADWRGDRLTGGIDPIGPASGTVRVMRGSGTLQSGFAARSAARGNASPLERDAGYGFRVALKRLPLPEVKLP